MVTLVWWLYVHEIYLIRKEFRLIPLKMITKLLLQKSIVYFALGIVIWQYPEKGQY
jgi:hypothetical protein